MEGDLRVTEDAPGVSEVAPSGMEGAGGGAEVVPF